MDLVLDAVAAGFTALAGAMVGWFCAKLPRPWWALGYLIALALVITYAVANHFPALSVTPPVSWMLLGRKKFATMGFITAMVLTTPLSRLPRKQDRVAIALLMVVIVGVMSIRPLLSPLFDRAKLSRLKTHIDKNGVCLQGTGYTCGPASAVTALRKLGFPAEEGSLAILSRTSSSGGTPDDILAEVLQKEYGKDGLITEFRVFKNLAQLKEAGLTLAVIKYGLFVEHYVTVLEVTDTEVVVGDPINGLQRLSRDEFLKEWRFEGVVLRRQQ